MPIPVTTSIYAALLTLLAIALILNVVARRRSQRVGLGDGGDATLNQRIRAHGNWVESAPVGILLLLLCELCGASALLLHGVGIALLVGRSIHAYGLSRSGGTSPGRMGGMLLTLAALLVMAVWLLLRAFLWHTTA